MADGAVRVACWNVNGLADYKQEELLRAAASAGIDVLALVETHLVDKESLADWEKEVERHG